MRHHTVTWSNTNQLTSVAPCCTRASVMTILRDSDRRLRTSLSVGRRNLIILHRARGSVMRDNQFSIQWYQVPLSEVKQSEREAPAGTERRNREAISLLSLMPVAHHVSSIAGKIWLCLACYLCLPYLCGAAQWKLVWIVILKITGTTA